MTLDRIKELARKAFNRIKEEPVLVTSAILMVANAAALFGFEVSPEDLAKLDAVLVPLLGLLTRHVVTPVSKLKRLSVDDIAEEIA